MSNIDPTYLDDEGDRSTERRPASSRSARNDPTAKVLSILGVALILAGGIWNLIIADDQVGVLSSNWYFLLYGVGIVLLVLGFRRRKRTEIV